MPSDTNDDTNQPAPIPADPSVNDVLAQQMGTDYAQVEETDKEALQKLLKDQAKEQLADEKSNFGSDTSEDTSYGQNLNRDSF